MKRRAVRRRVGVIMGGSSSERDTTLSAGHAVADALSARGHDVVRLSVGAGFGSELWASIQRARIDVAFLALSGRLGEDGCIQGLLELARIPYTGSSVLASALAMDKLKAKEMFRLHNVPTPPYYTVSVDDDLSDIADFHGSFGYPVMVKPRGEGASHGVSRVTNIEELRLALETAFDYDDVALVERFVTGIELTVAILDGEVLGAVQVAKADAPSFTLSPQRERGVLNLAERAARALGCRGAVCVDVLVTAGENEYVLEVNTQPVLAPDGLFAQAAAQKSYDFGALCESMLDGGRLYQSARRRAPADTLMAGAYRQSNAVAPVALMKSVG
jgi:D-alanine-D-alanine ligase